MNQSLLVALFVLAFSACNGEGGSSASVPAALATAQAAPVPQQPQPSVPAQPPALPALTERAAPPVAPSPSAMAKAASVPKATLQVVPFADGQDPFAALAAPKPEVMPAADTLRIAPRLPLRKGERLQAFPAPKPKDSVPTVAPRPLAVTRHSPEGAIDVVQGVTVTFNQPMVPLATLGQLDAAASPLEISPLPAGRFLWLSPETLVFEADGRLPYATQYRAAVKAGTVAANGQTLGDEFHWEFATPHLALLSVSPLEGNQTVGTDTIFALHFNARVSPQTVAKAANLEVPTGHNIVLVPTDPPAPQVAASVPAGPIAEAEATLLAQRVVYLKPARALSPSTHYTLTVDRALTSLEGPLPLGRTLRFPFGTYEHLRIVKISCSWDSQECDPGTPVSVEFNNVLRPVKGLAEFIRVTPAVADLEVRASSNFLTVSGAFLPSTTYQFEVLPGLGDIYGQRASSGGRATLKYGPASPFLRLAHTGFGVLEAKLPPTLTLSGMNRPSVQVRLAPVPAEKFWDAAVTAGSQGWHDRNTKQDSFAGLELAWKKEFNLGKPANRPVDQQLSLSPALSKDGFGAVLVEALDLTPGERYPQKHTAILVSTNLGLTALKAHSELAVLVTALDSATPLASVPVEARDCKGKVVASAQSGPDGLLRLTHPALALTACYLVATRGKDRS